jgi:hypothetical protein
MQRERAQRFAQVSVDSYVIIKSEYCGRVDVGAMTNSNALIVVRLASSPEVEGVTGRYFDGTREAHANRQAYDPQALGAERGIVWEFARVRCAPVTNGCLARR